MSTLTLRKTSLKCTAKKLVALAIIANVISPAQSEDGQSRMLRATHMSRCGPGDPELGLQMSQLINWKHQLETRLNKQVDLKNLKNEYAELPAPFAVAHFQVQQDGTITNVRMKFQSQAPALDRKFLTLIANSGPQESPANTLPSTLGINASIGLFGIMNGKKIMYFMIMFGSEDDRTDDELPK